MKISKWDPLGGMFAGNFLEPHGKDAVGCTWIPPVDVYETESRIVLTAELPGINQEDIELSILDNVLILRGDRRPEKNVQQENYQVLERSYGAFLRKFTMPTDVDSNKIAASLKDGVLTVTIPKITTSKKITVELTA